MNWVSIAVSAACGALGGAIGGLVTRGMRDRSKAKAVMVVPVVVAIVVGNQVVVPMVTPRIADALARTPYEKFERAYANDMQGDPDFKAYTQSLQARGLTQAQASAESRALGARGIRRLGDADLLRRAEILAKGLGAVDVPVCARVVRGTGTTDDFRTLVDAVGEEDALALATIVAAAVRAEVRQAPAARSESTESEAQRIMQAVAGRASPAELASIAKAFEAQSAQEEVCSGIRALYRHLPSVPELDRPRLALMLSGL